MSKAEKYIDDCTRNCSNELCAVEDRFGKKVISYCEWLTPDQAREAVKIAREEVIEQLGFKVENGEIVKLKPFNETLDRPITDYPLSVRVLNCLKAADINTLRELVRFTEMDLLKFRNFGKRSIYELSDFIKDHNLTWGMNV